MSFDLAPFGSLFSTPQKNGLTRPKSVRGSGVPMVNMNELFAFSRIHNIEMDLVPIVDKESHFLLETEDLLFARQSLVLAGAGKCSIFIGNTKPTVFESHIIRCRLNKTVSNPYFYYYFFQSVHGRIVMETIAEQGAGASGIRGSDLVKLLVPCPSKSYQDAIVKILTPLDDRISLLRETNTTLEAIAKTLFKSWFVDFDPVKAKAEGRLPEGMDEATAALFPSEFEESALGLIPKGWSNVSLKEVVSIFDSQRVPLSGGDRAKRKGNYPYYGAASLMDYIDGYIFDGVYCLMGEDGSVAHESGYPIMQYVWGKIWVNNHAHVLQGKNGISTEHVMLSLQRTNIQPLITGAVQAKLSQGNMWRIVFLMPSCSGLHLKRLRTAFNAI